MDTNALIDLQEKISKAKTEKAQAEGRKKELLDCMETDHGVRGVKKANKKIEKLQERADELQGQIDEGLEELQERYGKLREEHE
jgi:hypothetical protein